MPRSARLEALITANTTQFQAALARIQTLAGQTFARMAGQSSVFSASMTRSATAAGIAATQLGRMQRSTAGLGGAMNAAAAGATNAANAFNRAQASLNRLNATMGRGTQQATRMGSVFTDHFAGITAAVAVTQLTGYIDTWNRVERALEAAKDVFGVTVKSQQEVADAAKRTRSDLEGFATLYVRMAQASRGLAFSQEEIFTAAQSVALALKTGSATASEQRSIMTQLSQALIKGKLDGDEFRSVMENASVVQIALAKQLGVSTGQLQELSQKGLLQVTDVMKALIAIAPQLELAFSNSTATIGESFTNLKTSLIETAGEFDRVFDVSQTISDEIVTLDRHLNTLAGTFILVAQFIGDMEAAFHSALGATKDFVDELPLIIGAIAELLNLPVEFKEKGPLSADDRIRLLQRSVNELQPDIELKLGLARKAAEELDKIQEKMRGELPPAGGATTGGDKKRGKTPEEKFADDIAALKARTALLLQEAAVIGLSTVEQEKALAVQNLINEAKKAGIKDIEKFLPLINAEAAAYAFAVGELERLNDRFESMNELAREFGTSAIDAFEGLLDGTTSLNQSLAEVLKSLRRMILEAVILGEGPLAGIFGGGRSRGQGGGIGGIIGSVLGNIGGGGAARGLQSLGGPISTVTGGGAAGPTVRLLIQESSSFSTTVARIAGPITVQGIKQNNKVVPNLVANHQRRGL